MFAEPLTTESSPQFEDDVEKPGFEDRSMQTEPNGVCGNANLHIVMYKIKHIVHISFTHAEFLSPKVKKKNMILVMYVKHLYFWLLVISNRHIAFLLLKESQKVIEQCGKRVKYWWQGHVYSGSPWSDFVFL